MGGEGLRLSWGRGGSICTETIQMSCRAEDAAPDKETIKCKDPGGIRELHVIYSLG